jgi:hypothetical protein
MSTHYFFIIYIILLVFVLAVIYLKMIRKEKVHPIWFGILLFQVIIFPILYSYTIGYFSSTIETLNVK